MNNPLSNTDPSGLCPPYIGTSYTQPNGQSILVFQSNCQGSTTTRPNTATAGYDTSVDPGSGGSILSITDSSMGPGTVGGSNGRGMGTFSVTPGSSINKTLCAAGALWRPNMAPSANPAMQAVKQFANQAGRNLGPTNPRVLIQELGSIKGQPAMQNIGRTWTSEVWRPLEEFFEAVSTGSMGLDFALPVVLEPQLPQMLSPSCSVGPPS